MSRQLFAWWPLHRREGRLSREPGAALFWGLRIRLTLWYCGVLGAALVLFGVALYFGTQYFLLSPIEADAAGHAHAHVGQVLSRAPGACSTFGPFGQPGPDQGPFRSELVACFDQNGNLVQNYSTTQLPSAFLTNTLAKMALQTGQPQSDIVDAGGSTGQIYRYAEVVPGPSGSRYAGVVLIGESVKDQENALSLLVKLLLSIGGVALLGAGVGGLFLANRALAPARLAFTHQQRFIADASHELRTPLTLLRADAEVLLRGRDHLKAEDASLLEDIVAEVSYMSTLATNMLTLARLDAGSLHLERDIISLDEVATEVIHRANALAREKGIEIKVENADSALVIGDRVLLEQAVLALLDNAIKYNRPGDHVIVRTYENDTQAYLEVQDTGIGIAAEHLPHLGERFYRVDKARSREAGGTGLGLSIARGVAIAHGGTLTLTSIPEQGTTVTLMLPLVNGTASDLIDDAPGSVSSLPERTL
jgi:signal transduction histidine kinase